MAGLALFGVAGCGTGPDSSTRQPSSSRPPSTATPAPDPSPTDVALQGDWHDTDARWTVHFNEDGTFVEDFQGITDFRVGKYAVDGQTVSLIGDDGNTDEGTITGDTLVFKLGTLTRM